ncbi:MAG: 30S ribosomal protein S6 [Metamycoplasmataceae bacterium]
MSKYEIMLILDPNSKIEVAKTLVSSSFKNKPTEIKELDNIELAYEINKSKNGKYILILIEATGEEVNEFRRKANISKEIWRFLLINLSTEKGLNRKANPKRVKPVFSKFRNQNSEEKTDFVKKPYQPKESVNE